MMELTEMNCSESVPEPGGATGAAAAWLCLAGAIPLMLAALGCTCGSSSAARQEKEVPVAEITVDLDQDGAPDKVCLVSRQKADDVEAFVKVEFGPRGSGRVWTSEALGVVGRGLSFAGRKSLLAGATPAGARPRVFACCCPGWPANTGVRAFEFDPQTKAMRGIPFATPGPAGDSRPGQVSDVDGDESRISIDAEGQRIQVTGREYRLHGGFTIKTYEYEYRSGRYELVAKTAAGE
jgi:hypothetical protein